MFTVNCTGNILHTQTYWDWSQYTPLQIRIHEQSMNHISLEKKPTAIDVMQSHPLRRTRFNQYQASSAAGLISCTKGSSQVAGLIQKVKRLVCRSSLKASSLCTAVFCSKIIVTRCHLCIDNTWQLHVHTNSSMTQKGYGLFVFVCVIYAKSALNENNLLAWQGLC